MYIYLYIYICPISICLKICAYPFPHMYIYIYIYIYGEGYAHIPLHICCLETSMSNLTCRGACNLEFKLVVGLMLVMPVLLPEAESLTQLTL